MTEHEKIETFLEEVAALSERYDLWFVRSIMHKGVCIYDNALLRTVAEEVDADNDGYFFKDVNIND